MFLANILFVVAVLFGTAVNGLAAEASSVVLYDYEGKNLAINTAEVDSFQFRDGTKFEVASGGEDLPWVSVWTNTARGPVYFSVRPSWIKLIDSGKRAEVKNDLIVIRKKIISDQIVMDAVFSDMVSVYGQNLIGGLEDSSSSLDSLKIIRERFLANYGAVQRALGIVPDSYNLDLLGIHSSKIKPSRGSSVAGVESDHPDYPDRKSAMTTLETVKGIMTEDNIFDLDEAAQCFNVEVGSEMRQTLSSVPFSEEILQKSKDTHLLVADLGLSIEEMRSRKTEDFSEEWNGENELILRQEFKPHWRLVRKNIGVVGSWPEQNSSLKSGESVSSARAVIYDTFILKNLRGFVRTSSVSVQGPDRRIIIGYWNKKIAIFPGFDRANVMPYRIPNKGIGLAVSLIG